MKFSDLAGKTLVSVTGEVGGGEVRFRLDDGRECMLSHYQDCCESVDIEDIAGDLADLVGSPVILAEESTSNENPPDVKTPDYQEYFTWTFYRIATAKGLVVIRWYGSSNGCYSEAVDFTLKGER